MSRVYLVTSAFHMPRALASFRAKGLTVIPAPTGIAPPVKLHLGDFIPRASSLLASYLALHEWGGRLWYDVAFY